MRSTLFKYIFKMQAKMMFLVSLFFFCLIVLFDFAEVSRRTPVINVDDVMNAIKLSVMGALSTFEAIIHYVYFITSTFCLWHLCRSQQLIILKSSGRSPLQILYPFASFAAAISGIWLFILQPAGIWGDGKCRSIVNHEMVEYNENIWVDHYKSDQLIFIKKLVEGRANDIYLFDLKNNSKIIAEHADIKNNTVVLKNGVEIVDRNITSFKEKKYSGILGDELLKIVSLSPKKHDVYSLHKVYDVGSKGVALKEYEIEFQKMLVNCFTFILFALIPVLICLPLNKFRSKTDIVVKVISIAIVLRFVSSVFETMAYTGVLSIAQAIWGPILIVTSISIAVLVWREA